MLKRYLFLLAVAALAGLHNLRAQFAAPTAEALPLLSPAFGDHMVVQRDQPLRLWGWTSPGATVSVSFADREASAKASADGRWQAELTPPAAGGPYRLTVRTADGFGKVLEDVLVGDVWLCSGQSNMNWSLGMTDGGAEAAQLANPAWLRIIMTPGRSAYAPERTPTQRWQPVTPALAPSISGVAYYFAREWQSYTGVPVGIVQSALGGTPAESWISGPTLSRIGEFQSEVNEIAKLQARGVKPTGSFLMHWLEDFDVGGRDDFAWSKTDFPDQDWALQALPGSFGELTSSPHPVIAWFRREFELPADFPAEGEARLLLGSIHKMDTTFINGRWIGASSWAENPRSYSVPAGVLKPGRNVIAIRVLRRDDKGGFLVKPEDFRLDLKDGTRLTLVGPWRARVSLDAKPPHPQPLDWENYPTMPTVLHQGMIVPYAPLSLAGVLWYQGEANTSRAAQYHRLLPALIQDWRETFQRPDLPFYIAGLPRFMARRQQPSTDGWAELREAQAFTARDLPHTHVANLIDLGNPDDIHPRDKAPVGQRLARLALREQLGVAVAAHGPKFQDFAIEAASVRIRFSNTHGGLVLKGDRLTEFAVAGADQVWHWAEARIDGESVVVSSPAVPKPVAVRYAWQSNPDIRLFDQAGLPAAPFRTDTWPLAKP